MLMRTNNNLMELKKYKMKTLPVLMMVMILTWSDDVHSQLKVKSDGFVGIGTNHPETRLHVNGDGLIDSYAGPWGRAFWTRIHHKNTSAYNLWNEYFNGDVFFVNGEGWIWSSQGAYVGSDSTLIEEISPIVSPLLSIMQLNGQRLRYRDEKAEDAEAAYRFGLVAQEVEQVVPDVVRVLEDSTKAVAYTDLIPLLIEAMKEQQDQIESLQAALNIQTEEISRIKKKRWFRKKTEE